MSDTVPLMLRLTHSIQASGRHKTCATIPPNTCRYNRIVSRPAPARRIALLIRFSYLDSYTNHLNHTSAGALLSLHSQVRTLAPSFLNFVTKIRLSYLYLPYLTYLGIQEKKTTLLPKQDLGGFFFKKIMKVKRKNPTILRFYDTIIIKQNPIQFSTPLDQKFG